jgi:hypothetical protein
MHLGNGTAVMLIDERANPQQRAALARLGTGKDGGMPFQIFALVTAKWPVPTCRPLSFSPGTSSSGPASV